ncbi:hypothetical protein D9M72_638600 [compost metagenome]
MTCTLSSVVAEGASDGVAACWANAAAGTKAAAANAKVMAADNASRPCLRDIWFIPLSPLD